MAPTAPLIVTDPHVLTVTALPPVTATSPAVSITETDVVLAAAMLSSPVDVATLRFCRPVKPLTSKAAKPVPTALIVVTLRVWMSLTEIPVGSIIAASPFESTIFSVLPVPVPVMESSAVSVEG